MKVGFAGGANLLSISTPFSCNEDVAFIVGAATVTVKVGFTKLAFKFELLVVAKVADASLVDQ